MAKNSDTRGMNKKGQTVTFKGQKINFPAQPTAKPTEAITAKGQKATGLGKSDNANRFKSQASTPVTKAGKGFAGSGGSLGQGFASSRPAKPSNVLKAAAAAATVGAATGFKIVTRQVVSEATKKLQRELSNEMKTRSNKDIKNLPKRQREEIAYGRAMEAETPGEYYEYQAIPNQLRKEISRSMKKTTTTKRSIKRR